MSRPRTHVPAPARRLRGGLGAIAAILLVALATAGPALAAEAPISEGHLHWGVKESWRKYIGLGSSAGDGAQVTGWALDDKGDPRYAQGFSFPVASGSYEEETKTTRLELGGYVHFQAYCDASPPHRCLLDTKYSDLELEIGPTAQILRGTHTGYSREDPGGAVHEDEDVVLAKFDIAAAATDFSGAHSKWSAIPTVAGPGFSLYNEGTVLDSTSFEYVGPGGVPDLSEKWDTPGAPGLKPGATWLADPATSARVLHASLADDVVHTVDLVGARTVDAKLVIAARDAKTLEPVGTPYVWAFPAAVKNDRQELRTAFDPETDSVFFVTYNEGEARNQTTVRRAVWDPDTQSYAVETVGGIGVLSATRRVFGLVWNPVKDELAVIAYAGSAADPYEADTLHRFHLEEGTWVHAQTPLRLPDSGEWAGASSVASPFATGSAAEADSEPLAVARDGSYVAAPGTGRASVAGTLRYYPALQVTVAADGSAKVTPIAGTTTPRTALGTYYGFSSLAVDTDGSLLLHNSNQVMDAYARIDVVAGEAVRVGAIVDAPEDAYPPYELAGFANSMVADPERGLVWASDTFSLAGSQLAALDGEEILGRYQGLGFPEAGSKGAYARLAVAPDGSVYLPIKDPGSGRLGYRRLAFTGFVPKVTVQPSGQAVVLGPGQDSKPVQFTVAIANPGDAIQWQSKGPGAAAFTDIAGATGATLAVEAKAASDGLVYRAKVSNAAGTIVSDEAGLDVEYAPRIVSDLANREVTQGTDAVFVVSADGNPEPEVRWQRRIGGFWQPIAADDDNFVLNGPLLTVLDTNVEQSGSLFRAKLVNTAGTVYSRQGRLTVTPATEIPPQGVELDRAVLDWSGNAEMQKAPPFGGSNYFSAGVSAGDAITYSAASGNVRVFQVAAGGGETLATYPTRAAHVATGGSQLVRLYGGSGRVEADGSATVSWEGAFSINFYGGLVPFTLADPRLTVDDEGSGALSADLSGCESSQANPGVCVPIAGLADVTVATFSGVEVDPAGAVTIAPDYAGVEVELPAGTPPQVRNVPAWGAWPQPFVDFQLKTGLVSYWYTSGSSFDADKQPSPLLVDFEGEALSLEPKPVPEPESKPGPETGPGPERPGPPASAESRRASIVAAARARLNGGVATVATLVCPVAAEPCRVATPRRVRAKLGGRVFWATVSAPRSIAPGARAQVRARLPGPALKVLGAGRRVRLAVPIKIRTGDLLLVHTARVEVRG